MELLIVCLFLHFVSSRNGIMFSATLAVMQAAVKSNEKHLILSIRQITLCTKISTSKYHRNRVEK
jgi:hypothetical protein